MEKMSKTLLDALMSDTHSTIFELETEIEAIEVYITTYDMFTSEKTYHVINRLETENLKGLNNWTLDRLNTMEIDVSGCIWIKNSPNWIKLDVSEYDGQYFYKWILNKKPLRNNLSDNFYTKDDL
jgi:hypothetical protein